MATTVSSNATLLTAAQPAVAPTGLLGGPSASRPSGPLLGQEYYDTTVGYEIVWNGIIWTPVAPTPPNAVLYGPLANRPLSPYNGQPYYDTTLGGLECWNGSVWVFIGPTAAPSVLPPPQIVQQPASLTVAAASAASFTVLATGTGSLSYQWYLNGTAVGGATSNTYNIGSVTNSNAGSYFVIVTNANGSTQSITVTLTVTGTPFIITQPTSQTVTAGQSASFTVVAGGTNPLSYQWYFASGAISGANSATYNIPAASSSNAGNYYCNVSNGSGNINTSTVSLTVNAATTFQCTSFTGACVTNSTYPATIGFFYASGSNVTVTSAPFSGNMPPGITITAYSASGAVLTSAVSSGSTTSISVTYAVSGVGSSTVAVSSTSSTLLGVNITATASGAMVFTNCSLRATVYGPALFPANGYAMALSSGTVIPGSVCTAEFMSGPSTTQFLSGPYFSWNFNSVTASNPYVSFSPGTYINLIGYAGGSQLGDSRLDINSGSAIG